MSWLDQFRANALFVLKVGLSIGFITWGFRSRYRLDKPLDRDAKVVRWVVVACCGIVASLPAQGFSLVRVIAMSLGGAFFWWPNFAYFTMSYVRRREFAELAAELRRLNPAVLPTEGMTLYDRFVPVVLDALERGAASSDVQAVLAQIRLEIGANVAGDDRSAALELARWWRERRRGAA